MRAMGRLLVLFVLSVTLVACGGSSSGKSRDTTAPVITLTGDNPQLIEAGSPYVELGATATDDRDGDVSNAIVIDASQVDTSVRGSYVVNYAVSDKAGNAGRRSRTVIVQDTTPPVITLLGDNPQATLAGSPYVELGATAVDNIDGDISSDVVIDATGVDLSITGSYPVTYDVSDYSGNPAATVTRFVRVLVTGEWRQTGSMFSEMRLARAALLDDGRVLFVRYGGTYQAEIYDPVTEEFALAGEVPGGVPIVLLDGRVLIARGGPSSLYDPVAGAFRTIDPMNYPRGGFSATLLSDGRVLIAGGQNGGADCEILTSAEIFDPSTEQFTIAGSMSIPRTGHTATLLKDGTVLIVGGRSTELCDYQQEPQPTLSSAVLYVPATGMFQETGSMPGGGVGLNTADLLPDGNVLVVVGTEGWEGAKNVIYDVGSGTFEEAGDMANHRHRLNHRAVALGSSAACGGPVMVVGGSRIWNSLSSVELYDLEWGRFYSAADLPEARGGGHVAILLEDGHVLVAGGYYFEGDMHSISSKTAWIFEPIGACP